MSFCPAARARAGALGFVALCVILVLLEGRAWASLLSNWMVNMGFALVFMDLAFCYIKFKALSVLLRSPLKDRLELDSAGTFAGLSRPRG